MSRSLTAKVEYLGERDAMGSWGRFPIGILVVKWLNLVRDFPVKYKLISTTVGFSWIE